MWPASGSKFLIWSASGMASSLENLVQFLAPVTGKCVLEVWERASTSQVASTGLAPAATIRVLSLKRTNVLLALEL